MEHTHDNDHEYKIAPVADLDDWQVHEDDTDIRDWDVYTRTGEKIGEIETLIADTSIRKVRYAEIELEDEIYSLRDNSYRNTVQENYRTYYGDDDDRYTLVPIGMLHIDHDNKKVILSGNIGHTHVANSPLYAGSKNTAVTPPYELVIVRYYADMDDNYREVYDESKYNFETNRTSPYIKEHGFYDSDFFSRDRYLNHYQDRSTTMTGFNTGAPKH